MTTDEITDIDWEDETERGYRLCDTAEEVEQYHSQVSRRIDQSIDLDCPLDRDTDGDDAVDEWYDVVRANTRRHSDQCRADRLSDLAD